jgi:hypothetical protein
MVNVISGPLPMYSLMRIQTKLKTLKTLKERWGLYEI